MKDYMWISWTLDDERYYKPKFKQNSINIFYYSFYCGQIKESVG